MLDMSDDSRLLFYVQKGEQAKSFYLNYDDA